MTPAERNLIDAARQYAQEPGVRDGTPRLVRLLRAVKALDAAEAATPTITRYLVAYTANTLRGPQMGRAFATSDQSEVTEAIIEAWEALLYAEIPGTLSLRIHSFQRVAS